MATPGRQINHQARNVLGINDLEEVITTLETSDFPADRWSDLGLRLHISQPKLDTIKADNPQNAKACLNKCLILWLQQNYDVDKYGTPSLEKLATAVKEMGLRAVAIKIGQIDIIKPGGSSGLRIPVTIRSDVHREFHRLESKFADLVANLRAYLADKIKHQKLETIDVARFVEEKQKLSGLTDEVSIDRLFNRIQADYSYLNCSLIEAIVNRHVDKSFMECITGPFIFSLRREMNEYIKRMNRFKQSKHLKDLQSTIEKSYDRIISSTNTTCVVVIKLSGGWDEKTISDLDSLIKHYFQNEEIFNHLQITPGSVCVSYLVPRSAIAHITNAVKLKSESMHRVGVFYFSINDKVLLKENEIVNFDESLIEAVKLSDMFEVSLLLSLGADPYYRDSNGDSPIMLALLSESKEVAQLLVPAEWAAFNTVELNKTSVELESICMDVNEDMSSSYIEEQIETAIQKLQASKAEFSSLANTQLIDRMSYRKVIKIVMMINCLEEDLKNSKARVLDNKKDKTEEKQTEQEASLNLNMQQSIARDQVIKIPKNNVGIAITSVLMLLLAAVIEMAPIQVSDQTPMKTVVELFGKLGLRQAFVSHNSRLLGIVTKKDMLRHVSSMEKNPYSIGYH